MVEETFEPEMTVSLVARRHGVAPNQLFRVAPISGARQHQRRRLDRS
jgi:transposase-like protein